MVVVLVQVPGTSTHCLMSPLEVQVQVQVLLCQNLSEKYQQQVVVQGTRLQVQLLRPVQYHYSRQ